MQKQEDGNFARFTQRGLNNTFMHNQAQRGAVLFSETGAPPLPPAPDPAACVDNIACIPVISEFEPCGCRDPLKHLQCLPRAIQF